jgi:excisionase family DNA binding protein
MQTAVKLTPTSGSCDAEHDPTLLALPVKEAARRLSVGRSTAYEEIRLGRLQTVRIGRRRLVLVEHIDEYLNLLKQEARQAA